MDAYFPTLTAVSDSLVIMVVPELEDQLRPILEEGDIEYTTRWLFSSQEKKLVLQINWGTGEQSNIVLSAEQQKHLIPEILARGQIGLMFDYDPEAEKKTSGIFIVSKVDEGLKDIADQIDDS